MKNIGALVFLLIVVANVVGSFMQKRSEQAKKQRLQGIGESGSPAQRTATPGPPAANPGQSRLERLAARRQAQLEQLRGRREQRRSATSTQQARIGPASSSTIPVARPTAFRTPAPQPTRSVARPAAARGSVTLPSAAKKSRPQPTQRRRVSRQPATQPVERKGLGALHAEPTVRVTTKAAPKPFLSLDGQSITPQLLRRLVVLKEIFDAPIALRNRDIWDRPG